MYSGCDYLLSLYKSCLYTFWHCHPYFILKFYSIIFYTCYNNGTVQISWSRPLAVCSSRNISYNISLVPTYGNPMDEVSVTTEETRAMFHLTPGREYRASLIAINTDCSISSCAIQTIFTAIQNPIPGNYDKNFKY